MVFVAGFVYACGTSENGPLAPEPGVSAQNPGTFGTPRGPKSDVNGPVRGDRSEVSDVGQPSSSRGGPGSTGGASGPSEPPPVPPLVVGTPAQGEIPGDVGPHPDPGMIYEPPDSVRLAFEFSLATGTPLDAAGLPTLVSEPATWYAVTGRGGGAADGKSAAEALSLRGFFSHHVFPYSEGQNELRGLQKALAQSVDVGDFISFTPKASSAQRNAVKEAELGETATKFGAQVELSPFGSDGSLKNATVHSLDDLAHMLAQRTLPRALNFAFEPESQGKGSSPLSALMRLSPLDLPTGPIVPLFHKVTPEQTWVAFLRNRTMHAIVRVQPAKTEKSDKDEKGEKDEKGDKDKKGGCTRVHLSFPPGLVPSEITTSLLTLGTSAGGSSRNVEDAVAAAAIVPFSELTDCLPEDALLLVRGVLR